MPEGWAWTTLSEITSIIGDGLHGTPQYDIFGNYFFINGNNLVNRTIVIKEGTKKVSDDEYVKYRKTLNERTILVSINGTIGNIGTYNGEKIILGKSACYFNLLPDISKSYICNIIESDYFRKYAFKSATGSTIKNVPLKAINDFYIPLPPLQEQRRIVESIEHRLSFVDYIELDKEKLQETIKKAKSKVLDLAIHGKLVPQDPTDEPASELLKRINPKAEITSDNGHYQKLPEGWVITPMQTLCALVDGEKQNGIERINLDVKYLRGEREAKVLTSGKHTAANTLLILVDGENSGEIFRAPVDGYQGSTFKQLSIHEEMYTDYVLQVINLHRKTLRENKVGSAIPHLNKKLFKAINVPIPPYEEQKRIVNAINQTFTILDKIMENL
uniref:restriction endonuclease subunit S n=1 Tax=Prevotella sp. TaxID=59823 RepID=UPI00402A3522